MKKKTIAKLFLITVALFYVWFVGNNVAEDLKFMTDSADKVGGLTKSLIITGLLMVACISYFVYFSKQIVRTSNIFVFFLVWTVVVTVNAFLNLNINEYYAISTNTRIAITIQQALIHFCLFLFFFSIFKYNGRSLERILTYIIVGWYIIIALFYSVNYSALGQIVNSEQTDVLGSSYILLYPLPLALCLKNKFWKWFCVLIGVIVVMSSIKRGGVLGFAFAMLIYYFVQNFYINHTKYIVRNIIVTIFSVVLLASAFITYDNIINNGLIQERMNMISEDNGSYRGEVMTYLFNNIPNIPIDKLIFGYGYLGSVNFSPIHLSAHNDFLEVLYDYGLIGFGLYIWFYILIFKKIKYLIRQKSEYAAPLAAGFTLLLVLSMISHIIIFPYFAWYAIILGIFDGITVNKRKYQIKKILHFSNEKS